MVSYLIHDLLFDYGQIQLIFRYFKGSSYQRCITRMVGNITIIFQICVFLDKENRNNRVEGGKRVLDARKAQEGPQEDREERNNRRNKGSDGTGAGNETRQNEGGRAERDGDSGRGRGRGNRSSGGARGSGEGGGRGSRGGRGGGRGGKREFERKSGDDKT